MGAHPARRRRIGWILVALLGLVGVCLTWLVSTNLGVLKPQLEQIVADRVGREFSISGDLDIRVGRDIEVSAEKIFLANPDWAEAPAMVDIGHVALRVNLWSLISGPAIVEEFSVDNATIDLATNKDGAKTWTFGDSAAPEKPDEQKQPLNLWLETLEIDELRVTYRSADRPQPIDVHIRSLRQARQDDDMLQSSLDASINERDIELQGTWGTWASLLEGRDVRFDFEGRLDDISVDARGLVDDLRKPSRPELDFSVSGPSVSHLSALLGLGEVGEGNINLSGTLRPGSDDLLTLNLEGNAGQSEINITGSSPAIDDIRTLDIVAEARGPNLGQVMSYFGIHRISEAPFGLALNLKRGAAGLVIKDSSLIFGESQLTVSGSVPRFPDFDSANVDIDLTGPRIEDLRGILDIPGLATGPFQLRLDVRAGESGEPLVQANVETSLGAVEARGVIGDPPDYVGSALDFEIELNSLREIGRFAGTDALPDQPVTIIGSIARQDNRLALTKPLQVTTEGVSASISGALNLEPLVLGSTFGIDVEGTDLSDTLRRFGVDGGVPPLPFAASGPVHFKEHSLESGRISARIGSSNIDVEGLLALSGGLAGTRFRVAGKGPAMEELFSGLDDFDVVPGPFETSAEIRLDADNVRIDNLRLERDSGQVALNAEIGLPLSSKRLTVDLDANGPDIRTLFSSLAGFEPERLPFRVKLDAKRDGDEWSFRPALATLGDVSLEASGQLTLAEQSVSGRLSFAALIPDLATIGRYDGRQFKSMPAQLSATVDGRGDRVEIDDLLLSLDESDLSGQVSYLVAEIPDLTVRLRSESFTVLPLLEEEAVVDPDDKPADEDGRVIPDIEVPFDLLRNANASLDVAIGKLQRGDFRAENVELLGALRDGTLNIDTLRLDMPEGHLEFSGTFIAEEAGGQVQLRLSADKFPLMHASGNPMNTDVDFELRASGSTTRELAARSNGFIVLQATEGEFKRSAVMGMFVGGFGGELLNTINPFAQKQETTKLDCALIALTLTDGVLQGKPATYVQTDTVRVLADAVVNLKTEKISIAFETLPAKGLSLLSVSEIVNPYIGVFGTFSEPEIRIDQKSAFVAGGAAAATGGISILAKGVWDRLKGSGDACARAATVANDMIEKHTNHGDP